MIFPAPTTSQERIALDNAMGELRGEWGFVQSFRFEDLLRRWMRFVEDVERGYELGLDDFTQELALRDSLDDLMKKTPSSFCEIVTTWLEPWDQRYRFATREVGKPLMPIEGNERFWWWRLPNVLQGALLEAALAEHLV